MHIHLIFLFGALVAGAAFSGLLSLARRHPTWAFPALMLFLIGTQPLGYLIWGEPLASTYYLGWLALVQLQKNNNLGAADFFEQERHFKSNWSVRSCIFFSPGLLCAVVSVEQKIIKPLPLAEAERTVR